VTPRLTVRALRATPIRVPMNHVLGTSAAKVTAAPLMLFELHTNEGVTGRAYQFCYVAAAAKAIVALLEDVSDAIRGDAVAPVDLWAKLAKRYTLIGVQGIVRMCLSLVDVAAWDALARAAEVPLATYLGGSPHPLRAYNSNGLGLMDAAALADEAQALVAEGFGAVKLRLGYASLEEDIAAVHAVRERVGEAITVMVDYNQALGVTEALRRGHALDAEGVYWIEEPIRHDDYGGCARLAAELRTPIQIGENFSLAYDMEKALAARACDCVMPDLERIGGVSGWQRASALAYAGGVPVSSHLYPEVSAQLLCATPTAHWLEYVDWMGAVLSEPLRIENGMAITPEGVGNGLEWDEEKVRRYVVE
jgi:mandelate racemase